MGKKTVEQLISKFTLAILVGMSTLFFPFLAFRGKKSDYDEEEDEGTYY